jgi:DNA-binding NarL/FixJ family response regulator
MRRVIIVEDETAAAVNLRSMLTSIEPDIEVVDVLESVEESIGCFAKGVEADVVFMDIAMPEMDGAETTRRALQIKPDLRIITLSMFGDDHYYSLMVECGASGFLLKDSDIAEVYAAVDAVVAGDSYFSAALLGSMTRSMTRHMGDAEDEDALSEREVEILMEVCRGLSNQEIADKLFISKRTVDKHRANILEKTGCKNTANLVVYAIKNRLVEV